MSTLPYPWKCVSCGQRQVAPATIEYRTKIEHDGRSYEIVVPRLRVPLCKRCGQLVLVDSANRKISDAFRAVAGLLTPKEIRRKRETVLRQTQKEFAASLGVADATVSRWETGAQIQQRSLDRLMRLYFDVPEARRYLGDLPT